ncbi:LacI family DNA-binding transcriptional regulator [Enterococcus dongliensis]|uniref:LacI family DNA-binding transcriptional regulator n=1 Tax=Enterococcus dongliensis TaxID=2559925 RepID=A0AAP5KSP9_9ENTE|nr:LacI family DNA-binding transcriptional regulator [Enterococcus dongliensis]MDT2597809.1 LacI family DNA-binding transcriptional regulator [Enterococcus dongliensis]MDT2635750.1 LacI family DNA-binding transcriptional regulator [Enterococcus dongliensis]MDT2638315.1 LacI family DNA-binding transcriptional regulator [Enterococcus dongliensis]MDT2640959.1 LacI family DNA-binding transcriptional regulator [Enterococcus dongliensis]MDT2643560.1 LacI family DNA-binding transcriptional regulator 
MANIRDIAKITGYSVSTISRVINNHPYVDEKKREKILAVMKELNYVPNRSAQNLSYGKTKNIGVILPFINHPYYDQMLSGIMQAAFTHRYRVSLLPTNYDRELEKNYLDEFAMKTYDGLIVTTKSNPIHVFKDYHRYGPIIFCENIPDEPVNCVYYNLENSLREAFRYLKNHGVKHLGMTLGRSKNISHNSKVTLQIAEEIFPGFDRQNIFWDCCAHDQDGQKAVEFFKQRTVDGILTNGDEVAAVLLTQYHENPPLVIGRENLLISQLLGFSSIDHHLAKVGQSAFEAFFYHKQEKLCIPHTFIQR